MRSITMTRHTRLLAITLVAAVALFAALASLPATNGGGGALSQLAPESAQAFQSGIDGDHAWLKVTNGEIASGAVGAYCAAATSDIPYAFPMCAPIAATARKIIGDNNGVWFAIYTDGHYEYGTW